MNCVTPKGQVCVFVEADNMVVLGEDKENSVKLDWGKIELAVGDKVKITAIHWCLLKFVNENLLNTVFILFTRFLRLKTLSHFSNDYIGVGASKLGSPIFHECRTIHFQPDCRLFAKTQI